MAKVKRLTGKDCNLKEGYPTKQEAYNNALKVTAFNGQSSEFINAYYCRQHRSWHWGHSYYLRRAKRNRDFETYNKIRR